VRQAVFAFQQLLVDLVCGFGQLGVKFITHGYVLSLID
jgi:hypothetical protein